MRRSSRLTAALTAALAGVLTGRVALGPVAPSAGAGASGAPTAAVASPAEPGRRSSADGWLVAQVGAQRWQVVWRAPRALPVGAARPEVVGPADLRVPALVAPDGRTVTAVLEQPDAPDPAALDVVLSGDRLDERGRDDRAARRAPAGRAGAGTTRPATTPAPVDPGVPGEAAVVVSDYELPRLRVAGMRRPVEVEGHVVEPAQPSADAPLVVFLHGRHAWCHDPRRPDRFVVGWPCPRGTEQVPSLRGYEQTQRLLASQGYVTVSIGADGVNAQDGWLRDGGAGARSALVRHHLDAWVRWAAEGRAVDLSRVVLVGHSRGGEGVARTALDLPADAPWSVAGLALLAPTDFAAQAVPHVSSVTLLPHCDGDVSDLQGQLWTDRARDLDVGDTALHASLLVMGANHNYFNAEWTPGLAAAPAFDDWAGDPDATCGRRHPERLRPAAQRAVGATYVAAAARLFTGGVATDPAAAAAVLPLVDGTATSVASAGDADVRAHALGGGRLLVRPGLDAVLAEPAGGAVVQLCTGRTELQGPAALCGRAATEVAAPHWPSTGSGVPPVRALELAWSQAGARGGLVLGAPLDTTGRRWLDLRTVADPSRPDALLGVRLTDAAGASVEVDPVGGAVPALPRGDYALGKHWAQVLRVDLAAVSGVDLAAIRSVELVARSARGRVWVLDVAAVAEGAAALPPASPLRGPVVSLGTVRVVEGDGSGAPGSAVAEVPFTVAGVLERPGRFTVVSGDGRRSGLTTVTVDVAAGQTSGVVRWPYRADVADDLPEQRFGLFAFAVRGLMTAQHTGRLVVLDDDPTPRVTVTPVRAVVDEGRALRWRVAVAGPLDYLLPVQARFVPGPGAPLRQADVPREFLRDRVRLDPGRSLGRSLLFLGEFLGPAGRPSAAVLTLPTRRDGRAEGREDVGVRIRIGGAGTPARVVSRTGVVRASGGAS
ncbi:alpha/beta hydrolase family protein [Nocardioides perillae]|uniref:Dienelactone hydrolase n=1 Tax=Nocardioides perillae TaxID=1119534 RepID=A0A7Y9RZ71_9ACTN|nr:hypothetical protein [Nocardioides perillae]NYG56645.1 dienelactone hydrolase [Nocardioides perillae]